MEHVLKIWPCYFESVAGGIKTFEYRYFDRDYKVGDTLRLREYDPDTELFSGRECLVRVTYLMRVWDRHNQPYCIMSFIRDN